MIGQMEVGANAKQLGWARTRRKVLSKNY